MISRIERGLVSPSIATLARIAPALRLPTVALFDDDVRFWALLLREGMPLPECSADETPC